MSTLIFTSGDNSEPWICPGTNSDAESFTQPIHDVSVWFLIWFQNQAQFFDGHDDRFQYIADVIGADGVITTETGGNQIDGVSAGSLEAD